MLPGPIFNVELLTSARRARYFMVRAGYGLVLLVALWVVYQSHESSRGYSRYSRAAADDIHSVAALSAEFFTAFSWLQLLAVLILAPAMVAGAIASERERRTIEYLFASRLSNAEIVLGKLAARLVHVVYLMLVGVPVLALMMMLGGIAPEALLLLFIVTLSSMLAACSLAMAVSVWSLRAREAVTRAYLVLFALLVLPLLVSLLRFPISGSGYGALVYAQCIAPVNEQFLLANPFLTLTDTMTMASGATRGVAFQLVWAMVRNQGIVTLLCAAAATLAVRRVHLRQRTTVSRRRWRLTHLWRPGIGGNPMLWKEIFAEPAASRLGWIGRITVTLIVLGVVGLTLYMFLTVQASGLARYQTAIQMYLEFALPLGTVLACGALLMVAARAAGSIASERERDCWTSLLSTPLEPGEIIWAKIAGSVWSLRGAVALLVLMYGLGVAVDPTFFFAAPFLLGTFLLLAFYASALGVSFSLRCRTSLRAMGATLATLLAVGGLYFFCCVPLIFASGPGSGDGIMLMFTPCVPFLLAMPGVIYMHGADMGREGGTMLFAYILGVFGYLVAAFVLAHDSIGRFDSATGRTGLRMSSSLSAARNELLAARGRTAPRTLYPPPEPLVVATLVDEPSAD